MLAIMPPPPPPPPPAPPSPNVQLPPVVIQPPISPQPSPVIQQVPPQPLRLRPLQQHEVNQYNALQQQVQAQMPQPIVPIVAGTKRIKKKSKKVLSNADVIREEVAMFDADNMLDRAGAQIVLQLILSSQDPARIQAYQGVLAELFSDVAKQAQIDLAAGVNYLVGLGEDEIAVERQRIENLADDWIQRQIVLERDAARARQQAAAQQQQVSPKKEEVKKEEVKEQVKEEAKQVVPQIQEEEKKQNIVEEEKESYASKVKRAAEYASQSVKYLVDAKIKKRLVQAEEYITYLYEIFIQNMPSLEQMRQQIRDAAANGISEGLYMIRLTRDFISSIPFADMFDAFAQIIGLFKDGVLGIGELNIKFGGMFLSMVGEIGLRTFEYLYTNNRITRGAFEAVQSLFVAMGQRSQELIIRGIDNAQEYIDSLGESMERRQAGLDELKEAIIQYVNCEATMESTRMNRLVNSTVVSIQDQIFSGFYQPVQGRGVQIQQYNRLRPLGEEEKKEEEKKYVQREESKRPAQQDLYNSLRSVTDFIGRNISQLKSSAATILNDALFQRTQLKEELRQKLQEAGLSIKDIEVLKKNTVKSIQQSCKELKKLLEAYKKLQAKASQNKKTLSAPILNTRNAIVKMIRDLRAELSNARGEFARAAFNVRRLQNGVEASQNEELKSGIDEMVQDLQRGQGIMDEADQAINEVEDEARPHIDEWYLIEDNLEPAEANNPPVPERLAVPYSLGQIIPRGGTLTRQFGQGSVTVTMPSQNPVSYPRMIQEGNIRRIVNKGDKGYETAKRIDKNDKD